MSPAKSDAWKKYVNIYPYLLGYDLNESYPYKKLADQFGVELSSVQHMVRYLQGKPEVIAWIRAQFDPTTIPPWVGVFTGENPDYVGYLHSIGVVLPGESGADVSMDGSDEVDDDYGDDDSDTAEDTPPVQPSTIQANHTEPEAPRGTQTLHPDPPTQSHPESSRKKPDHPPRDTQKKPSNQLSQPIDDTQTTQKEPSDIPSRPRNDTQKKPSSVIQPTLKKPPSPTIKVEEKVIPVNISERVKQGEATLEEKPTVIQSRKVMEETFTGVQQHDPTKVQLPDGTWGTLRKTSSGGYMAVPSDAPPMEVEAQFEAAVNEVTFQEMKVNALAILKKVAMTPSTVMGYAYAQSATNEKGVPYFIGDIGDFINYCVRFTLKFGMGVEFAIVSGKPTIADVIKQPEANN